MTEFLSFLLFIGMGILMLVSTVFGVIKGIINKKKNKTGKPLGESLDDIINKAGYAYDEKQDIFYSELYPWQRDMGYCRLYDEATAPLSMIIDCEPIYFRYDNRRWLIQFWKGQYGMTTGSEIGVYNTNDIDIDIPGIYKGAFYKVISDDELLDMACVLKKNGKVLFKRRAKHWWLTGFKLGEFSEPHELVMDIEITLLDKAMADAFVKGLKDAGYKDSEIKVNQNTVSLTFDKPKTKQPITRNKETERYFQERNKSFCEQYKKITAPYDNYRDKLNAVSKESDELYDAITNLGRHREVFNFYVVISNYLN